MRTTLELPDALVTDAMEITKIQTKTDVIKTALENLISKGIIPRPLGRKAGGVGDMFPHRYVI
ncbi:hypothetical protein AGMMS49944_18400 [Spirochaetia bacterium]|nr:hypothetical protein AGMMS49944_18400 [Spirochaetia bacterium]